MIGTRLNIMLLVSVLAVFLAGAVLYGATRQVREESARVEIMDAISKGAFELSILADEYARTQEKRPRRQWQARYDSLEPWVAKLDRFDDQGDRATIEKMRKTFASLRPTFANWIAARQVDPDDAGGELATVWHGNIVMLIRGLDDNARLLHAASHDRLHVDWQRVSIVIVALILAMLASFLAFVLFIRQRVLRPVRILRAGAAIVGAGDLTYKINSTARDELGELARTFDRMTANLSAITASRDALNREMAERQRAEAALAEAARTWQVTFDAMRDAVFILDFNGTIKQCNKAVADLLGKSFSEINGATCWELMHGTSGPIAGCPISRMRETGQRADLLLPVGDQWLHVTVDPIRDEAGHIVAAVHIVSDITAMKQSEEKLRESEEYIRLLLNSTAEGIYGLDPVGNCTFCNAACLRLLGYEREEEFLGRNMHEVIHHTRPDGAPYPAAECRSHGVYRGEAVHEEDEVFWRRDGSSLPVEYWAHPVAKGGKVVGAVVTFVDITVRKEAIESLQQTMAKLKRSNEELERFAYVASHDLQEPLRMVSSYVQLLGDEYGDRLGPEADIYIGFARDGATRMQRMINDLLLYSRVRTRENPMAPVELEAVFASALDNLRLAIAESKAEITHEPLPTVVADAAQLIQVFQNLLGNAIKFRSEEPPRIQVSAAKKEDIWLFAIKDNGIGFDPGQAERIFQAFQGLHAKTKYPGTGIGLSICKRVVERHGGRIWAESEPGKGSIFYFTIPEGKAEG